MLRSQLCKTGQSGEFFGRPLGPLLKAGLPLIGNVLKALAKCLLIRLELTATKSAADAAIHKKMFESANTALVVSNEEMKYIMKIVKSLAESRLLIKRASETTKNEAKGKKGGFLSII